MRIISGIYRGRKIIAPAGLPVRPTTDAAKETLFNMLQNQYAFDLCSFLDLFSGTGNISYEAISRGCADVTSVDYNFRCTGYIKDKAGELGMKGIQIVKMNVYKFLKEARKTYDVIFADPPYADPDIRALHNLVFGRMLLNTGGSLIIEHGHRQDLSGLAHCKDRRTIGHVNFTTFML